MCLAFLGFCTKGWFKGRICFQNRSCGWTQCPHGNITNKPTCIDMEGPRSKHSYSALRMFSLFHIFIEAENVEMYIIMSYQPTENTTGREDGISERETQIFTSFQTLYSVLSWSSFGSFSLSQWCRHGSNLWASAVCQQFSFPLLSPLHSPLFKDKAMNVLAWHRAS